jgi:uncharacterized repeat protein (TIGR03803 family)
MIDLNHSPNLVVRRSAICFHALSLLSVLLAGAGLITVGGVRAQTYVNSDGANPYSALALMSHTLYGTAAAGGIEGNGTVFAINTDGTGFTNLHSLNYSDGVSPNGLVLCSSTLYSTTYGGGSSGNGTVFAINADGTGFTNLHSFNYSDGASPIAGLVLSDNSNTLYGATTIGGSSGNGTIFAIHIDGMGFANLHDFSASSTNSSGFYTNSDGDYPSGLLASGNTLYGTTQNGGSWGGGTVFKANTNGSGFTTLYSFQSTGKNPSGAYTNGNGANPLGLILSGNTLYGTTASGGTSGFGTVFKVNTDGTEFTNLHSFNDSSDGAFPRAGLVLSGNTLYGTAMAGPRSNAGSVFAINTDGTGFTNLHSFNNNDGIRPNGLVLWSNTLYGTTFGSTYSGSYGTIFAINTDSTGFTNLYNFTATYIQPPRLTVTLSAANVVLTWPTNSYGEGTYVLISTTNLVSPAGWTTVSPPVVVNGQNTVTNSISGTPRFYSLAWGCLRDSDCGNPCYGCVPDARFNHCVKQCQ